MDTMKKERKKEKQKRREEGRNKEKEGEIKDERKNGKIWGTSDKRKIEEGNKEEMKPGNEAKEKGKGIYES